MAAVGVLATSGSRPPQPYHLKLVEVPRTRPQEFARRLPEGIQSSPRLIGTADSSTTGGTESNRSKSQLYVKEPADSAPLSRVLTIAGEATRSSLRLS